MNSEDYKKKRAEFSRLGIDELVSRLSDPDLQVRFFAEMALRDATST